VVNTEAKPRCNSKCSSLLAAGAFGKNRVDRKEVEFIVSSSQEVVNPFRVAVSQINSACDRLNIDDAFEEVLRISQLEKVDMRTAAHLLAVGRLAQAMTPRGDISIIT